MANLNTPRFQFFTLKTTTSDKPYNIYIDLLSSKSPAPWAACKNGVSGWALTFCTTDTSLTEHSMAIPSLEDGKELRRTNHRLPDHNDPQGPIPRHFYHAVGWPRNGT